MSRRSRVVSRWIATLGLSSTPDLRADALAAQPELWFDYPRTRAIATPSAQGRACADGAQTGHPAYMANRRSHLPDPRDTSTQRPNRLDVLMRAEPAWMS